MSTALKNGVQRFTRNNKCPVCGGCEENDRGNGTRCHGYIKGNTIYCTREEHSSGCSFNAGSNAYSHRLRGKCECGVEHNPEESSNGKAKVKKTLVKAYQYHDENGNVVHETLRYRLENGEKKFSQRRPDGKGGYIYKGVFDGITRVLYRLPNLLKADTDRPVYIVEGEKDVDRLESLGRLATCNPEGAEKWRDHFSETLHGRHVIILADNDDVGRKHAQQVARSLHGKAASIKIVELPGLPEKGDVSDFLAGGGTVDQIDELARKAPSWDPASDTNRENVPEILITTREKEVNDQAVKALAADPEVYRLGFLLATILHEGEAPRGIQYKDGPPPQLAPIEAATLRERMAATARWLKTKEKDGSIVPAHPPQWAVQAVHKRGIWPGIRPIVGIVEAPTIRPDGSILSKPGYDPETRLFYRPNADFDPIPESPTKADAEAARDILYDVVEDFPFKDDNHKAVWLTSLLTVIGRPAFTGPAPLFAFDGNCPGSGKGKLADAVAVTASGRRCPRTIWPSGSNADEEMRKRITSLALAAERFTLLDNVDAPLGGGPLDAALTSDTWKDRVLGSMATTPELPMAMVWLASGNNLQYRGDFLRRVLPCRLESQLENPEERSDFKHPDLLAHVLANRGKLVRAALIILRAHRAAGSPSLVPLLGSYESWTRAIVDPVRWVTNKNPLDVRAEVKASDHGTQIRTALVEGWAEVPGTDVGLTVATVLGRLGQEQHAMEYDALRSALMELSDKGNFPSARSIGRHLNAMKGRVVTVKDSKGVEVEQLILHGLSTRTGVVAWKVERRPRPEPKPEPDH